jgi:16S rRNA (guanine527-N7)-methyltransferase
MELNGIRVSRETVSRLETFANLFEKWAKAINLVAPSTKADFWTRHVADSAQIYQLSPGPFTWVDLGSGGGFPGIITAIFLTELNDGWVHLVESNQKKASFLRTALLETGARGSVHPVRIETAGSVVPRCDRISARALAELPLLLDYTSQWMLTDQNVKAYLHKGRDYAVEVNNANSRWQFDLLQHPSLIEADSTILEIAHLRHKV